MRYLKSLKKVYDGITVGVAILAVLCMCAIDSESNLPFIVLMCTAAYLVIFMITNWERIQSWGD